VRDAIEQLYQAYAPVPLNPDVGYCGHCISPAEVTALHSYPVREIPVRTIGRLLTKGISTWGDEDYFRHFVPRLLELTAAGELADYSVSSYLPSKMRLALTAGTPGERDAVGQFLAAWWTDTLARDPAEASAQNVFEMTTAFGWPGAPLLSILENAPLGHLVDFVSLTAVESPPPPEVETWLRSGVPAALLTAAGTATDDEEQLSWALEVLRHNY
jgi:hypothetical protein